MTTTKPFLETLKGHIQPVPPIWLMRQAGRYLPEYRDLRKQAGSFQAMIRNPDYATEVTLQPLRRFGFDAAILFSDILVIPSALGQKVEFEDGRGPVLEPLKNIELLDLTHLHENLNPVYQAVEKIKAALPAEGFERTALIGFAGAPWTVACYMIEGGGSKEFSATRSLAYGDPERFTQLIDILSVATVEYLCRQIDAGAEAVQIFDSWAGILPEEEFKRWVIAPTISIVSALRQKHPDVPVIGFPRAAGSMYAPYAQQTGVTALGLDERVSPSEARKFNLPLQGNLDPFVLLAGGSVLDKEVDRILAAFEDVPFVFNLGHGINKNTPPEHVLQLVNRVRMKERM